MDKVIEIMIGDAIIRVRPGDMVAGMHHPPNISYNAGNNVFLRTVSGKLYKLENVARLVPDEEE